MTPVDRAKAPRPGMAPIERHDTLADHAYEQLRHALMSGSFRPGQKVTIRKMAAVLGVSTTPAREAINRLVTERVLDSGAFRTVSVPALDAVRLAEIYIMRGALEGLATEIGAGKITRQGIETLEQIQLALIGAMDRKDYKTVLAENESFHFLIYKAAEMPLLLEAIQQLWLKLGPSLNLLYPSYNQSRKGVNHHLQIIQALRDGDAVAARQRMEDDLRDGGAEIQRAIVAANENVIPSKMPKLRSGKKIALAPGLVTASAD